MSTSDRFADLKRFEGCVMHLYKDTKGFITAGVGFKLDTLADAQRLSWDIPGQVRLDWVAVQAARAGELPEYYRSITRARLLPASLDGEILRRMGGLPTWMLSLPATVQAAMYDIKYNTGNLTEKEWPHMFAALRARDWKTAAKESRRPDVGKERNAWTAAQILKGAAA
jgi:GH24 family phage-related lysozyme (muramidase)